MSRWMRAAVGLDANIDATPVASSDATPVANSDATPVTNTDSTPVANTELISPWCAEAVAKAPPECTPRSDFVTARYNGSAVFIGYV